MNLCACLHFADLHSGTLRNCGRRGNMPGTQGAGKESTAVPWAFPCLHPLRLVFLASAPTRWHLPPGIRLAAVPVSPVVQGYERLL
jgi:hypothetical protein